MERYHEEVIEMIKVVEELNEFYHEKGGNENDYPFSLTTVGWISTISYWDTIIYKDFEDDRQCIATADGGEDYEPLKNFLIREANNINADRSMVYLI